MDNVLKNQTNILQSAVDCIKKLQNGKRNPEYEKNEENEEIELVLKQDSFDIMKFSSQFEKPPNNSFFTSLAQYFPTLIGRFREFAVQTQEPCNEKICKKNSNQIALTELQLDKIKDFIGKNSNFSFDSSISSFSIELNEMLVAEKQLATKIKEMEKRDQSYDDILQKNKEMYAKLEDSYKKQLALAAQDDENERLKFEEFANTLKDENARLRAEIKNIRLELNKCVSNVHEPMCEELEKEMARTQKLERALLESRRSTTSKELIYKKNMDDFEKQLKCTFVSVRELTSANEQLQREIETMKSKYDDLHEDLVHQQVSEARTLRMLEDVLSSLSVIE